ncbi:serine hydrolase domain-containing protein [Rathayibacter soli]|uniref:serine hydrolase domain-containing protein n=1 Tax=Rathayibacter soli TaxID=3144168 RepID=UPI0027E3E056|nr:serine hydrolase domain-containing protein [Glaciibacter superstes]
MGSRTARLRRSLALAVTALLALGLMACTGASGATPKLPAQASGSLPSDVTKQLQTAVTDAMTRAGASGAIVGVWAPWAGTWTAALGTVSKDKGAAKMSTNMSFRIASNSKSMTCTVLLALVDRGQVELSDRVSKYLPRLVGLDGVTLGQLCHNTSGIADYEPSLAAQFVNNPTRQWVPMELISDGLAEPATGVAGDHFAYSNTGFVLLGMALQAATGRSWSDLYQDYVWGPLGLKNTSLPNAGVTALPSPHPQGYATALNPGGQPVCETVVDDTQLSPSMGWTAGGVVSTLNDLKTYVQALAAGTLVSPASAKEQWTTMPLSSTSPTWQGYGMGVITLGPMRGHDGEIPGFISSMMSDPKSGLTVVVMLNNSTLGGGFAQLLGMQLASIASKVPATTGKAPVIALPWSSDQAKQGMAANTICPPKGVTPQPSDTAVPLPQSGD